MHTPANLTRNRLRAGMVGLGMIFDETYRPLFEQLHAEGLYRRDFGAVEVELTAVATRTGRRAGSVSDRSNRIGPFVNCVEPDSVGQLLKQPVHVVRAATPDDRH